MKRKRKDKMPISIGMADFYRFYRRENKEKNNKVSRGLYGAIVKDFFYLLIQEIMKGFIFNMPYKLGHIGIQRYKPKIEFDDDGFNFIKSNVSIDFGATNKLWREQPELKHKQYIYHVNEHTNGYKYRIRWSKKGAFVKGIQSFKFQPSRYFNRSLAKYIKNNPNQEYYEI